MYFVTIVQVIFSFVFLTLTSDYSDNKQSIGKSLFIFTRDTFLCDYQVLLSNYPVFDLNHRFCFWCN